jgi:Spy/CpxP family protein refolding chaperone
MKKFMLAAAAAAMAIGSLVATAAEARDWRHHGGYHHRYDRGRHHGWNRGGYHRPMHGYGHQRDHHRR